MQRLLYCSMLLLLLSTPLLAENLISTPTIGVPETEFAQVAAAELSQEFPLVIPNLADGSKPHIRLISGNPEILSSDDIFLLEEDNHYALVFETNPVVGDRQIEISLVVFYDNEPVVKNLVFKIQGQEEQ